MTTHSPADLHEHLFRHEAGRMTASLTRLFGVQNFALVEDVVQDAFCRALEIWKLRGVPPNPSAWLMTTARNRALDVIRRERTARTFAPELTRLLETEWTAAAVVAEAFSGDVVLAEQLRMMFSCCHPDLAEPAQIALILNILCGFGAPEIAAAFLTSRAAIEKRIARGKRALAGASTLFDLSDADFAARLSAVHRALYLLFNEGYHSASTQAAVRAELCEEAMRLTALLREHPVTRTPATFALSALMALHAARLPARVDATGELQSLWEQDRSAWNLELIAQGRELLDRSAAGDELTAYHVEAAIAAVHAAAPTVAATDWNAIVTLYDRLMEIAPSAVVALNRAIAIAQRDGPDQGIEAIERIADRDRLDAYPFFPAALGELERRRGNVGEARHYFEQALGLARSDAERRYIERRIQTALR
ncbi:MAG: sigma factor, ECF subfamily protein [Gemmatimonadetes bacterium]|nr:MAG: sigma factor, ECF subfamily protein [Gemmatimonadota bacterium]PYP95081.1 MAG: sigma factor, ECF subfamily protein [Gemmatimonadota bacterium]